MAIHSKIPNHTNKPNHVIKRYHVIIFIWISRVEVSIKTRRPSSEKTWGSLMRSDTSPEILDGRMSRNRPLRKETTNSNRLKRLPAKSLNTGKEAKHFAQPTKSSKAKNLMKSADQQVKPAKVGSDYLDYYY